MSAPYTQWGGKKEQVHDAVINVTTTGAGTGTLVAATTSGARRIIPVGAWWSVTTGVTVKFFSGTTGGTALSGAVPARQTGMVIPFSEHGIMKPTTGTAALIVKLGAAGTVAGNLKYITVST